MKPGTRVRYMIDSDGNGKIRRGTGVVVKPPEGAQPREGFLYVKKDRGGAVGQFKLNELKERI